MPRLHVMGPIVRYLRNNNWLYYSGFQCCEYKAGLWMFVLVSDGVPYVCSC